MVLWVMMIFDAIVKKDVVLCKSEQFNVSLIVVHEIEMIAKGLKVPVFITTAGPYDIMM